jgi:predicted PurR-regulated permease PerM
MTILYILILAFIVAVWIFSIYDMVRRYSRNQLSGSHLALWLVAVLVFPMVGSLVYAIVRPAAPLEDTA